MLTIAAWLHDLDPFVFRITETFGVRWYGLAYVAGFLAAWAILKTLARRGSILLREELVTDLIVTVIVGTLVGGRLGYVLFYSPDLLTSFESSFPFWGVLAFHRGGMASHGGMVGIAIASWLFARKHKLSFAHVADCLAFVAPVGVFFGRLANFINGELLGKIVALPGERAPWWSVKFPQELVEGHAPELSTDQQEALLELLQKVARPEDPPGVAVERLLEAVRAHTPGVREALEPLISARHASQLYQAAAEGIVVGVLLAALWAKPRKPGVIAAWFLVSYGVGRVLTEFIRLPDAHLAVQRIAGLSRGQWLSVLMIVVGAAALWRIGRSSARAVGGWMSSAQRFS
ncbi:MAG: prolipoprotein diacylglyceryl transferase [Planctomycetota bacterium]|nr:prolipoprotein diacylglyceryl transferase [Planctomycetota bacterium]